MAGLTWLHLSDWHQKGPDFDRDVVRDKLLEDLRGRVDGICPDLRHIDFIVFSGDVAHNSSEKEFKAAARHLIEPVLSETGVAPERLFIVPGNHDLDRAAFKFMPDEIKKPFTSHDQIKEWLAEGDERDSILKQAICNALNVCEKKY